MTYRLVAVDLDGTLLDQERQLRPTTVEIIKTVAAQGVKFTIATGRLYPSALPFARQLGLDVPIITYNGAMIKSSLSGEVIQHLTLTRDLAREALQLMANEDLYRFLYLEDCIYTDAAEYVQYSAALQVPIHLVEDLNPVLETNPTMVVFRAAQEKIPGLTEKLAANFGEAVYVLNSWPDFVELLHPQASKAKALARLAADLGIRREEIIAIGDGWNDVEMLEYAGLGVAVANAQAEVKARADLVTNGKHEEGVREVLARYFL